MRASLGHTPERRPAQTVTLPDELAAVLADEDSLGLPAGLAPVFRALNATENGLVSARRPAWEWQARAWRSAVPRHRPATNHAGRAA